MLAFTSRLFVRGIVRYVDTTRDPALYSGSVAVRGGELSGSALLAYKLNWQSVMFVGYGDDRCRTPAASNRSTVNSSSSSPTPFSDDSSPRRSTQSAQSPQSKTFGTLCRASAGLV